MTLQNKLVIDKNSLRDVDVMISRYLKQEASIESNLKIEAERKSLSSSITSKDRMIEEINRGISENSSKIELIRSEKEKREKNAELLKSLEFESQSYFRSFS
jgi:chromosome segregation ATPase